MKKHWLRLVMLAVLGITLSSGSAEARRWGGWWGGWRPPVTPPPVYPPRRPPRGGGGGGTPAVPEPGTMVLMGSGLAAVAWVRKRRSSETDDTDD